MPPPAPSAVPQVIAEAARTLPKRAGDSSPTQGYAYTADGKPLTAEPLRSGRNVAPTAGLRPIPGVRGWPYTLTDHVESIVAATMRAPGGPTDVRLVLNNPPCNYDYLSCNRLLRHIIPAGSRLTIYVKDSTDPAGARQHRIYHGTGKGIAP